MDDEYVEASLAYRWPFIPVRMWKFIVKVFGGHQVSEDR